MSAGLTVEEVRKRLFVGEDVGAGVRLLGNVNRCARFIISPSCGAVCPSWKSPTLVATRRQVSLPETPAKPLPEDRGPEFRQGRRA